MVVWGTYWRDAALGVSPNQPWLIGMDVHVEFAGSCGYEAVFTANASAANIVSIEV